MKLRVRNDRGGYHRWLDNFHHEVDRRWSVSPHMPHTWMDVRRALLTEWNCNLVVEEEATPYMVFENEEDATLFLLRWA